MKRFKNNEALVVNKKMLDQSEYEKVLKYLNGINKEKYHDALALSKVASLELLELSEIAEKEETNGK